MPERLTILVPNYNRAVALARLLDSIFAAIKHAKADEHVHVTVVDDYSSEDISTAVMRYAGRSNFTFELQARRCGNAEVAFLSALDRVETEFVWLLGNDDEISVDGIEYVLQVLDSTPAGFVLLHPYIRKRPPNRGLIPISCTAESVIYERTHDLFMDFGFVTSTTTFPCLIMKTGPVREFHRRHHLTEHGTVYAHTFTIFSALRDEPGLLLAAPIVSFNGSEPVEEHLKLQGQAPDGIMFYHHSIGLARLIRGCSNATGVAIRDLGAAFEDEINKDTMKVLPTHLSHFLTHFFLEQLCSEQTNIAAPKQDFAHLNRAEMGEVTAVIERFEDPCLLRILAEANEIFAWPGASAHWKTEFLRGAQQRVRQAALAKYDAARLTLPTTGPLKVAMPNHAVTALRGTAGGRYGRKSNWAQTKRLGSSLLASPASATPQDLPLASR